MGDADPLYAPCGRTLARRQTKAPGTPASQQAFQGATEDPSLVPIRHKGAVRAKGLQRLLVGHREPHDRVVRAPAHAAGPKVLVFGPDELVRVAVWKVPAHACCVGIPGQLDVDVRHLSGGKHLLGPHPGSSLVCAGHAEVVAKDRERGKSLGDLPYGCLLVGVAGETGNDSHALPPLSLGSSRRRLGDRSRLPVSRSRYARGSTHASAISTPNPGASLGTSQPSLGAACPGKPHPSSSGTPGGVLTKHSSQGTAAVAQEKCCP